jgi:hypothetical protein
MSKLNTILQASKILSVLPSANVTALFNPGFIFNLAPCPPLPHTMHCPPFPGTRPQALMLTADPQQSHHPGGSHTLILSDGILLIFTEDDVPDLPTTTFTDDILWLNQMWDDDTSVYWNWDLVLKILGHPIPIDHWPEVYKQWKQGNWDVIKLNMLTGRYVNMFLFFFLFSLTFLPSDRLLSSSTTGAHLMSSGESLGMARRTFHTQQLLLASQQNVSKRTR